MQSALPPERLLGCLVAALLVTAAVPASVASASVASTPTASTSAVSGASVPASETASATPGVPISFADDFVSEQRGDVAEIGVRFAEDADATATVRIGNGTTHVATVVVRDADGDDRAELRFNTYDGTVTASDGDAATVRERSNVATPLATGGYELDLWAGNGTDGERWDAALLSLDGRETDGLLTRIAPDWAELSDLRDLHAARKAGNVTRSESVARNDTLVLELRASGLEGAIAAEDGRNVTERFVAFLERDGVSLAAHDRPGPEQERAYLDLTDPSAVTVVPDPRNDSYYLVVDLRNVSVTDEDGGEPANNRELESGYEATFTLAADSTLTANEETVTTDFSVEHPRAALDTPPETDRVYLAPAPNRTISGTTNLAPGHRVTVAVRGPDGAVRSKTVSVRNDTEVPGRFAAAFDFGEVPAGSNVTVRVSHAGRPLLDDYPDEPTVTATVAPLDAAVNLTDRGLTAQGVLVENAVLSHGGYLAVHRGSAEGEVVVRSERLAPGEEFGEFVDFGPALASNATLVAVAHRAGEDGTLGDPYTENGTVVSDSVRFTVETTTVTTTAPESESTTSESTTSDSERTTDGPMRDGTTTDGATTTDGTATTGTGATGDPDPPGVTETVPGFGVSSALAALLVGLLGYRKARRR